MNTYGYVGGNPTKYHDRFGLVIDLQWHEVAFGSYHTSIRITPCNKEKWKNDPRFSNVDDEGNRYLTIGAGPDTFNTLVSNLNREKDAEPHGLDQVTPLNSNECGCDEEDKQIELLLSLDAAYRDNLDYDFSPSNPNQRSWYWPDDGYNSNSYVSGLLDAANIDRPVLPVSTPGYNVPVPISNFR